MCGSALCSQSRCINCYLQTMQWHHCLRLLVLNTAVVVLKWSETVLKSEVTLKVCVGDWYQLTSTGHTAQDTWFVIELKWIVAVLKETVVVTFENWLLFYVDTEVIILYGRVFEFELKLTASELRYSLSNLLNLGDTLSKLVNRSPCVCG